MSITINELITEALNSDYSPCNDATIPDYINCLGELVCAEVDKISNETCKTAEDLIRINRGSASE